jgi:hypothetical protein
MLPARTAPESSLWQSKFHTAIDTRRVAPENLLLKPLGDIPTIHWRLPVFRAFLADSGKTGSTLRLLMLLLAIATLLFCSRCELFGANEMKTDEACHAQGAGC